jgi:sigma54-dependent transcription regulator
MRVVGIPVGIPRLGIFDGCRDGSSNAPRIGTAARRERSRSSTSSYDPHLKGGIETRNTAFNRLIDRIEQVAIARHATHYC